MTVRPFLLYDRAALILQGVELFSTPTGGFFKNKKDFCVGWHQMRMDDLDTERCSVEAEEALLASLAWLGMDHDGPIIRQRATPANHRMALERLSEAGLIFACDRSRRDLRAAAEALGAPHESGMNLVSTPAMRPEDRAAWGLQDGPLNHRLALAAGEEVVEDVLLGTRGSSCAAQSKS